MTAPTAAGRYNPDDPALRYGSSTRHAALSAAASGIRVRRSQLPVEAVLLVAAVILFPLGLVFIFLGWYGAAHTGRLYAQIDYLISGGLLGVALSVAGGFMYFGYWLSRQLGESRRQSGLSLQSLQRIEDLLEATLNSSADPGSSFGPVAVQAARSGPQPSARARIDRPSKSGPSKSGPAKSGPAYSRPAGSRRAGSGSDPGGDDPTGEVPLTATPVLLATPRGSLLHRPQCPVVAKRDDLRSVPAGSEGFGYCSMCDAAGALA